MFLFLPLNAQTSPDADSEKLEPVVTSITVVGEVKSETPANITVLGKLDLARIPGVSIDDRLRLVPGFSLFRRSSSLVANPTTQGVSLRGLGSSGASRSLVLWDGIPVNDPFGGWVYWTRLAPDAIERIEILRGASTSVFGDRAMSGAIGLLSPPAERWTGHIGFEGGNLGQKLVSGGASHLWSNWALSGNLRAFETDGYFIVPRSIRGLADSTADTRFLAPYVRADVFNGSHRLFLKADVLVEDRDNGTVLQRNSTSLGTLAAHYTTGDVNNLSLLGYHSRQEFRASFSAIAADRNSERLTTRQSVPSEATGGALLFRRPFAQYGLLAGADVVRVEGYSIDALVPTGQRIGGGTQLQHGVFGQGHADFGPARLFFGLRHHFAGGGNRFLSPSGGVTVGRGWIRGRASAYRSFRAPTLNELFREFRAGNAVTQPNALLKPESSTGVEAGVDLLGETRRFSLSLFRNSLDDVITNVTLSSTPQQIIRQRRNAASALSRGVELEFRQRWRWLHGEASYLYGDTRFSTGERVPQVPRHQGSAQASFVRAGTVATAGLRSYSLQFEDDRNTLVLPGFAVIHLSLRQSIGKGVSALFAMENAYDRVFYVGFTPTPNIGAPRLFRLGLRWDGRFRP